MALRLAISAAAARRRSRTARVAAAALGISGVAHREGMAHK